MNRARQFAYVALLTAGLCALSCTKKEPAAATPESQTAPPPAAAAASNTATTASAPPTATTATTATTASAAPTSGAIASTEGERAGARIEITELKRTSGGTVNLKFVLINNSDHDFNTASEYFGDPQVSKDHYRDVSGIHLLDPVNKKKYFVVTDSDKSCVCSKEVANVPGGGRTSLWAKFPAPPPEVTKVTIEIPHFQPIDDVPISQ